MTKDDFIKLIDEALKNHGIAATSTKCRTQYVKKPEKIVDAHLEQCERY